MYGIISRLPVCLVSIALFLVSSSSLSFAAIVPGGDFCPKILLARDAVPKLGVEDLGNYLPRGGALIPIEKAPGLFTVVLKDKSKAAELDALPGIVKKSQVRSSTYLVEVDSSHLEEAMEFARSQGSVAHHAYKMASNDPAHYFLTERIVVRTQPTVTIDGAKKLAADLGLQFDSAVDGLENTYLFRVTPGAGKNPIKAANELGKQAQVDWAEPDLLNKLIHDAGPVIPKDTLFPKQWHLHQGRANLDLNEAQLAQYNDQAGIDAPGAWQYTKGEGAVVAILDDGFDMEHPDLKSGAKTIVSPKDYSDGDADPLPGESDYHGTPCAGVALAAMNDDGTVGVAPACAFMPVRFPLNVSDTELQTIFNHISEHADVVSCSWGPPPVYAPLSSVVKETFTKLHANGGRRKKGLAIVFAGGNANSPINDPDNKEFEWLDYGWGMTRKTKGPILNGYVDHPGVFGVAASSSLAQKSLYSSWGKGINVAAPSNNFDPINPREKVPGLGIVTADNEKVGQGFNKDSQYTDRFGGTSSATPTVAGLLGLVIAANPALTAAEAYRVIEDTADRIEDASVDPHLGTSYGTYETDDTGRLYSKWFGYGRINARAAVERAIQLKNARSTSLALVGAFLRDSAGFDLAQIAKVVGPDVALPRPRFDLGKFLGFNSNIEVTGAVYLGFSKNPEEMSRKLYATAYEIVLSAVLTKQRIPEKAIRAKLRELVLGIRRS